MDGVLVNVETSQSIAYLLNLHVRVVELDNIVATTSEVNAKVHATEGEGAQADDEEADADNERGLAHGNKVVVLVFQEVTSQLCGEGDFSVFVEHTFKDET